MTLAFILTISISIISALFVCGFITYFINRKKPQLLRKSLIQTNETDNTTTFNWDTILAIILASVTFGGGVYTILGVIVFIFYKELYLDGASIGLMAIIFLVFVGKELDKFWNKHLK